MGETELQLKMNDIVGEVGVFGALTLVHHAFDRDVFGQHIHKTYPVIQEQLSYFSEHLQACCDMVDAPMDSDVYREFVKERFEKHGIRALHDHADCQEG